ncbi:MAG TPA: hypothetical protein VF885_05945 [Arthrobacter sp.]
MKTRVPAATLILAAALLTGCAPAAVIEVVSIDEPTVSASPAPMGTIGPVDASSWDAAQHPDRVRQEDFIRKVATEYTVWAPGKAWRVSGTDWEPGEEVTLVLQHGATAIGKPVKARADGTGQFVTAFGLPAEATPGTGYTITAVGRMGFSENQSLTVVNPG